MRNIVKYLFLFVVGGLVYMAIEMLWRGYTHWTMAILGGLCFILCGCVNEFLDWDTPLWIQMFICSALITICEFVCGYVVNIKLCLAIWDYSNMPFNICGQICLQYMIAWYYLSFAAIVLDDYLRYFFFGEEKPHYSLF